MERTSKLADLKLVSKYYPVTNYSYPQTPTYPPHHQYAQPQQSERQSQYGRRRGRFSEERSSLGSEGSAPGLIDDRTDSEVSLDDDYQYHTDAAELWDTFWGPDSDENDDPKEIVELPHPRKQYPALIPSPAPTTVQQRVKHVPEEHRRAGAAWPLQENSSARNRKPAATYSPFPKPIALPPRTTSLVPSWQSSRPTGKPNRPPRPDDLLIPCVPPISPLTAHFATSPEAHCTEFSRPVTPKEHRPTEHRPTTSMSTTLEVRPATSADNRSSMSTIACRSVIHLPVPDAPNQPVAPALMPKKSMPCLKPVQPTFIPMPEPQSVFEYDSDDDEESHGLSFFRFHKRMASSDTRRSSKSSESAKAKKRGRASTAPSSPIREHPERSSKEMGVIGRMFGLRSRQS